MELEGRCSMRTSEQINEIATACAKAQVALKPAAKDATNPAFRSKYADHAAIVEASRVYAAQGVAVFQDVTLSEIGADVTTRLAHSSGQWIEFGPLTVPLSKRDAHGVGSATTYAKRYGLSAALGISAEEDDDGNEAASKPAPSRPVAVQKAAPPVGYENWFTDLASASDAGAARLRKAWNDSKEPFQAYAQTYDRARLDALKAKAAAVAAS